MAREAQAALALFRLTAGTAGSDFHCTTSQCWLAVGPPAALLLLWGRLISTCCVSRANNMKALGVGDFLRNTQICFPNGFSC